MLNIASVTYIYVFIKFECFLFHSQEPAVTLYDDVKRPVTSSYMDDATSQILCLILANKSVRILSVYNNVIIITQFSNFTHNFNFTLLFSYPLTREH